MVQLSGLFISVIMVMQNASSTSKLIHAESESDISAQIVDIPSSSYVIGLKDLVFSPNWFSFYRIIGQSVIGHLDKSITIKTAI